MPSGIRTRRDWVTFPHYRPPIETFERHMLVGDVDPATPGPQVQALLQPCGEVIASHFHDVPQFQVIVGGSGIIGRHRMGRGALRYVDRHRVYGPVRPDDSGLAYLTLRAEHDPGPHYMPDSRDDLAARQPVDPRGLGFDVVALDTCWREVTYGDPDELYVCARNLGRYETLDITMAGGGGFVVVIGGSLQHPLMKDIAVKVVTAPAVSACWLAAGDRLDYARAGEHGGRVLWLQFPFDGGPRGPVS